MFAQLLRCLCNCRPGRPSARRDEATGTAAPEYHTKVPPEMAPLLDIEGIGTRTVQYLVEGGYATAEQVRLASREELAAVPGVGERAAELLKRGLERG